jgi:hypothetical protein
MVGWLVGWLVAVKLQAEIKSKGKVVPVLN